MICGHCGERDVTVAHVKSHTGTQSVQEPIEFPDMVGPENTIMEFKDPQFTMESTAAKFLGVQKAAPTEKQINFAHKLLDKYVPAEAPEILEIEERDGITAAHEAINAMDRDEIGHYLSRMTKSSFDMLRPSRPRSRSGHVGEGVYKMDGDIFKVVRAVHGSGHLYVKQFNKRECKFQKCTGVLDKLREEHRMPFADAQAFGKLYGICVRCGRTLTDEDSIREGMGPVCADKVREGR